MTHMWSVQVNVPCELQRNVHSTLAEWSRLETSIRSGCLVVPFWLTVETLNLFALSIPTGVLKHPLQQRVCLVLIAVLSFCVTFLTLCTSRIVCLLGEFILFSLCSALFNSDHFPCSEGRGGVLRSSDKSQSLVCLHPWAVTIPHQVRQEGKSGQEA